MNDQMFPRQFTEALRPGTYLRIIVEGSVGALGGSLQGSDIYRAEKRGETRRADFLKVFAGFCLFELVSRRPKTIRNDLGKFENQVHSANTRIEGNAVGTSIFYDASNGSLQLCHNFARTICLNVFESEN